MKAAAPQLLAFRGIGGASHGDVQRKGGDLIPLLHPAHPPADASTRGVLPAGFGMQSPARARVHPSDLGHLLLGAAGEGQALVGQAREEAGLLHGADRQRAPQPEGGHVVTDLFVAIAQAQRDQPQPKGN